ncbi:MAG: DUF3014 domain-containing protein [Gammaproteobacteria bacterium]
MNRFVGLGALVIVAFGALIAVKSFSGNGVHELTAARPAAKSVTAPAGAPAAAAVTAAPSDATAGPLPSLNGSDPEMRKALSGLFGAESIDAYLRPTSIIRHIVAFVDSLPRKHIGADSQPIKTIVGGFIATGDEQATPLVAENAAKYTPYVAVIGRVSPKLVSDLYFHYHPLFQQAYEELTKSDGHFDDRVLQAIDGLIDAPEIRDPVLVIRREALYEFVDPNLEQLSVGQKFMIRLGPENAAAIKSTLRALRESIVARSAP